MHDPIRDSAGEQKRYAERDAIGVEATGLAHRRGINAELDYLRKQHAAQTLEHDGMGVHDTPQIAAAFIDYDWDITRSLIEVSDRSYLLGNYGSSVAMVTRLTAGIYLVDLATVLETSDLAVMDASMQRDGQIPSSFDDALPVVDVRANRGSMTAKSFEVHRYEGFPGGMVLTDGPFQILVHVG